jgi:hypothetical protein
VTVPASWRHKSANIMLPLGRNELTKEMMMQKAQGALCSKCYSSCGNWRTLSKSIAECAGSKEEQDLRKRNQLIDAALKSCRFA